MASALQITTTPPLTGSALVAAANVALASIVADPQTFASAATVDVGSVASLNLIVTGGVTITSFGSHANLVVGQIKRIRFSGTLQITRTVTSLETPTGANISILPNDAIELEYQGSGNWRVTSVKLATPSAGGGLSDNSVTAVKLATSSLGQLTHMVNGTVVESRAASASTLAIKTLAGADPSASDPVYFVFRNATLGTGNFVVRTVTAALSVTIPSTATLGHASGRDQQIFLYAIDNAGAVELAVSNNLFAQPVRLISTTALSGAATSPVTLYSTTARTNVSWEPIAWITSNQATAGTWAAAPVQVDLAPFEIPNNSCKIYLNSNQTGILSLTHTKLLLDTVAFDPQSVSVLASNRIQPKVAGTYIVVAGINISATWNGLGVVSVALNGSRVSQTLMQIPNTGAAVEAGTTILDFLQLNGTTDFLEIQGYITTLSGTGSFQAGLNTTSLRCVRTGPY